MQELIYKEFFSQGDLEKAQGQKPMAMMDRDSACIPELQIDFLDKIALPVFRSIDANSSTLKATFVIQPLFYVDHWPKGLIVCQFFCRLLCAILPDCYVVGSVEQNKNNWIKMHKRSKTMKLGQSFDVLHVPLEDEEQQCNS